MIKRFLRDEAGMTMGLAVIMIVVIGVMGAGLLTFVQRDLNSVVEVNQGQRAFDLADTGVEMAKKRIKGFPDPELYDFDATSGPLDAFQYLVNCNVADTNPSSSESDSPWSLRSNGYTDSFEDGSFTVTIRHLSKKPLANDECKAPVAASSQYTEYYEVVSTGQYNGATRRVEAILEKYDGGFPRGFFSETGIKVNGGSAITGVSLFTPGDVDLRGGARISGRDSGYDNWLNPPYNEKQRPDQGGTPMTEAGIGAAGSITGGDASKMGKRDFDSTTSPKFVRGPYFENPPAGADTNRTTSSGGKITFPFDPTSRTQVDLAELEEIAREQDANCSDFHYVETSAVYDLNDGRWPADDPDCPAKVVYVKFVGGSRGSNKVVWKTDGTESLPAPYPAECRGPIREGLIVVENGDFATPSSGTTSIFKGAVIVRDVQTVQKGAYRDEGSGTCIEGFANTDGQIEISGNVTPFSASDVLETPGLFGVRIWSWRELYE